MASIALGRVTKSTQIHVHMHLLNKTIENSPRATLPVKFCWLLLIFEANTTKTAKLYWMHYTLRKAYTSVYVCASDRRGAQEVLVSHTIKFGHDEHTNGLVKGAAHAQTLLVWAPIQAGDWLSRQGHILQEVHCASNAHVNLLGVLLASFGWVIIFP